MEIIKFVCDGFVLPDCRRLENIRLFDVLPVKENDLLQEYYWNAVVNTEVKRIYVRGRVDTPYIFDDFYEPHDGLTVVPSQEVIYKGSLSELGKLDHKGGKIPIKALIAIQPPDSPPINFIDYMAAEAKNGRHPDLPLYKQQVVRRDVKEIIDISQYCEELKKLVDKRNEIMRRYCMWVEEERNAFKHTYQICDDTQPITPLSVEKTT